MSGKPFHIAIIGAGSSGLAAAILLHRSLSERSLNFKISIYELRPGRSTLGGAVNLTPNSVRLLQYPLGVYDKLKQTGCEVQIIEMISSRTLSPLGDLTFGDMQKFGADSLRVARKDLQNVLLDKIEELEGVEVHYGKKLLNIEQEYEGSFVTAEFSDGEKVVADILVGCDGTHSAVRTHIDPERQPVYSGVSSAYSYVDIQDADILPFDKTAIFQARNGSMLVSRSTPSRTERIFWAAVIPMDAPGDSSKDGWRTMGSDTDAVKNKVKEIYGVEGNPKMGFLQKMLDEGDEGVYFHPVWKLEMSDNWYKGRVLILGDAAHAVSYFSCRTKRFQGNS